MTVVVLSLGTNLGDRAANMRAMTAEVRSFLGPATRFTPVVETEPVGAAGEWYYNCLAEGQYAGSAEELLAACQAIERRLGRTRPYPNAPRTCDIDILLFGDSRVARPALTVPHPEIRNRRFCLEGLMSLAPGRVLPGLSATVSELCRDMAPEVRRQQVRPARDTAEGR